MFMALCFVEYIEYNIYKLYIIYEGYADAIINRIHIP
jgi:hypothetical protein